MGYKLLYDKQILFDVYSGDYVTDAQLSMSVNAISYFDFTISLTHSLYDIIAEHAGIVELYFDDAKLFSGEITKISVDLNGNKDITCAGALDYLSYTLVRPYSTIDGEADLLAPSSIDGYFNWLIEQHNKHCLDSRKHFFVGVNQGNLLDNNNYIYRASSTLPTTSSEIEDKILNSIGGYLYVRYKDDKNILDLYADTHEANTQIIDFGVNITDFVKTTSTDDQYTAVIATGYTPDPPEDDPQKKMNPITLEGCVDGGTPYSPSIVKMGDVVYDVNAVARYGYKEYHVSNDDIKTYDGLLQYACKVLNKLLSPSLSVSVKAVDLSLYMKDKYEHMQVGQAVRVRSKLHNIDEYLVVNSITLDMNNPENTEYQLGESYDTLTGQQSSYLRSLNSSIVSNLDSVAKLDSETKKNAKDIADTKVVASNAANKANQASEDAANATSKANEANNKADTATETANSASSKADEANAKANTATNTANSANAKADEAKADAANANTKADAATETANSASQNAQKAQEGVAAAKDAASKAQAAADKAQADANTNTKAVAQAQSTADAAKKAAADAQEKAENVESNLESANAVIEQHSNKLGELDTKVSNAVTNANSALTASTEAKQTATEASTTANTAYEDSQTAITNSTKATQTATEAKTTAESAVSTANDSLIQSSSAVQTANRIENTLTTEYQTKADSDALYATKSSLTETSESIKMEVSATYATKSTVEALQNVADNAIESWRGSGIPTSENKPASDWTTIEEKKRHSGDLYYDKDTGKAYRWGSDDGVIYSWVLNQDTDITKALQDASNAQKSANAAQSTANGAVTAAGNAQKSAEGAQSTADSAKTAAANAQKAADSVQSDVDQLKIDIPGTYATKASLETTAESITAQVESVSTTANSAVTAASKAQQTADAINVNLTKNYQTKENADNTYATKASLSATSESLSSSITKAQQTADGAVNAASNAQQTADAININLTKNYQTTKDADDKYATQTSLNATAETITSTVSKTYATKTDLEATTNKAIAADNKAQDAKDTADKNKSEIVSMGEQLVINGSGLMGDNTNFSSLIFDASKSNGSAGSFTRIGSTYVNVYSDMFFPVSPTIRYSFELDAMSSKEKATMYSFFDFYDVDKKQITAGDHMYVENTLTTLAKDLKNGDTIVYLTDMTNWLTSGGNGIYTRGFIFWNYKNSFGYTYPEHTYSKHSWADLYMDSGINTAAKTITLKHPWTKGTFPAGTKVSQSNSGATFKYQAMGNSIPPTEWRHYSGHYDGTDYSGKNVRDKFPPGAAYAKVGFLWNYNNSDDQVWITNISVKTDYKHAIDEVATRVTNAETSIKQNSDAIALRATKTEVTSAIDGISVGGRNLLLGTATFDTTDISNMYDRDAGLNNSESFRGNSVLKYNKAWNRYYIVLSKFIQKYNLKGGDFVTYSIWFKFTTDNLKDSDKKTLHINGYNGMSKSENYNTLLDTLNVIDDANVWKRYSITFKVPESISEANNNIRIECDYFTESDYTSPRLTQWWSSPKLEFANKATDWSPAPEDLVAESKTYTDAQIKVSADSINSTVSSVKTTADSALSNANSALDQINEIPGTYATKTEVNQTATDLTTTITTAQNTANDAKGAAESAQTTANEAKGTADSAKTSTNVLETLIRQSGDGVEVAKKVNDEYTSTKTLMGPDGFYIKDLTDTALTQVKSNSIILGKETESHMHINPENVQLLNGNEKELAKFYENGVTLSSNDFAIRSPIKSDPVTDIRTIGGFNIHSVLDDRFQSIVPIDNNNICSIKGYSNVFNKTSIGENITTITEASSDIVIKTRANSKGTDTTADSNASISIGAYSSVFNSDSTVDNKSNITIDANIIQLRAKDRIDIKGKTLKDFVKGFGTSTTTDSQWPSKTWDWRWIKTYSGKCFAWGECGFNIGCTNAWGSGYYDHVCPVYPFKLSKWNVQASTSFIGGGIGLTGIYDDSATQCPIYIWSAVYQNTGTMYVKVFVEGILA